MLILYSKSANQHAFLRSALHDEMDLYEERELKEKYK